MYCFICYKNIDNEKKHSIFNNNFVCESCYCNQSYYYCDNCGEATPDKYFCEQFNEYKDCWEKLCVQCYYEYTGKYPHDYKPRSIFHSYNNVDRKYCLHIGAELELEGDKYNEFSTEVYNKLGDDYFYMKEDGSLNDNGIEVVSHPMILPIALKKWGELFEFITKHSMIGTSNCGLHLHLDKAYLKDRQIRNIDFIINTFVNSVKNIGGRDIISNEWAERIIKRMEDWGFVTRCDGKYHAVNFCENTIELRCFNSTENWQKFRQILIDVFALVEYAKIHKFSYFSKMKDEDFWDSFRSFVKRYSMKNLIK